MQVVNFIPVPSVETKCLVYQLFNLMSRHLKMFCYENECVCEIREKSLIVTMPIDIYLEFSRSSLYTLLRYGFDVMQTEPFTHKSSVALAIRFDFNRIPKNLKTSVYKKYSQFVFGKGLQELLVHKCLWINRFTENPYSL